MDDNIMAIIVMAFITVVLGVMGYQMGKPDTDYVTIPVNRYCETLGYKVTK